MDFLRSCLNAAKGGFRLAVLVSRIAMKIKKSQSCDDGDYVKTEDRPPCSTKLKTAVPRAAIFCHEWSAQLNQRSGYLSSPGIRPSTVTTLVPDLTSRASTRATAPG